MRGHPQPLWEAVVTGVCPSHLHPSPTMTFKHELWVPALLKPFLRGKECSLCMPVTDTKNFPSPASPHKQNSGASPTEQKPVAQSGTTAPCTPQPHVAVTPFPQRTCWSLLISSSPVGLQLPQQVAATGHPGSSGDPSEGKSPHRSGNASALALPTSSLPASGLSSPRPVPGSWHL